MEMSLDSPAGQPNEQSRHEHLGHGHHMAGHDGPWPYSCHPHREETDRAPQEDGGPNMNMDLARYAIPRARGEDDRDNDASHPLEEHQPAKQLVGLDRKSTRLNSSHSQISYAVF